MKQYLDLVQHVLDKGVRKENRTGVDTLSTFGYYYEHDLREGFPLLTTKKISWKNIVLENLWFLSGQTNISFLQRHGCKFWDPWADKEGNVPSAYGNIWRHFPVPGKDGLVEYNDQIQWVLNELKRNPMSRRMIVSAWAPGNAQSSGLPPCHYTFALNVQNEEAQDGERPWEVIAPYFGGADNLGVVWAISENKARELARSEFGLDSFFAVQKPSSSMIEKYVAQRKDATKESIINKRLCLHLSQRSADTILGVPYNLAGYAFLIELFSRFSGIAPGIFGHTLVDAHIYTSKADGSMAEYDHVPGAKIQLSRTPRPLPRLIIDDSIRDLEDIERLVHPSVTTEQIMNLFRLEGYDPHPTLSFKVAV